MSEKFGEVTLLRLRLEKLESQVAMFLEMAEENDLAICDRCGKHWFRATTGPGRDAFTLGDQRGVYVAGKAVCLECLDLLYEETADMDQDELDGVRETIAHWLTRYPQNAKSLAFGSDPDVLALMRRYRP